MSEDLFFWRSPLFGLKNCLNLSKDLFWTPLFGQKNCLNLSEDLFFLEITFIWTEKAIDLSGNFQVNFWAKLWSPPNHFEPLCPCPWYYSLFLRYEDQRT